MPAQHRIVPPANRARRVDLAELEHLAMSSECPDPAWLDRALDPMRTQGGPDVMANDTAPDTADTGFDHPLHDARALTDGGTKASIRLDDKVYTLMITRAGKLILTK